MSLLLTKHDGTVVEFPLAELAQTLAHLVAGGNTRCQGQSGVTLLSAGGTGLLLVDTSWHIGRRLVETYTVVSEASFPFGVAFQQGSAMYTLAQALAGAGFAGAVDSLASVYMAQYTTTGGALTYLAPSNLVLDEGSFQTRPAKIRRLSADGAYIQATEGEDDVTIEAGPSLLALPGEIEALQSEVAGVEASLTSKVEAETFEAAVADLVAADATNAAAITATQSALDSTDQALAALTVEVAGKQPQLGVGSVEGGHPLLEDGAIKAILGTAPVQVTAAATHVEVAMDQSYFDALTATDQALAALTADVATKADQAALDATNAVVATKADQAALDATNAVVATKADQAALDVEIERLDNVAGQTGSNAGNIATLQSAASSLFESVGELDTRVTSNAAAIATKADQSALDATNATVAGKADQASLNSTDQALAALTVEVDGKQDALSAGTGLVFHERLLEANTIKSLTAGNNVTLVSTGEFVSISAEGGGAVTSADGPAGTFSMVNEAGEIRRIRAGAGAYAMDQGDSVEVGVQLQAAQFQAPFAVMDQTNATALRARLGETKAEFFTDVEVNGAADVSGIFSAGQLRSEGLVQVGVNPPAGATVAVDGTVRATGNISTTAALRADGVEPLTGSTVNVAGDLTTTGTTRCDVFKGRAANQVTCQDNLTVEGLVVCQDGLTVAQGVAAQTIFCQGNLSVLGDVVGWSPFFCAGVVDGTTLNTLASQGRVGFTVQRMPNYAAGVYRIFYNSPHPAGDNYTVMVHGRGSNTYLTPAIQESPDTQSSTHVNITLRNTTATAIVDAIFHFAVL